MKNWKASIWIDGKQYRIGSQGNEEEAGFDYARAVFKCKEAMVNAARYECNLLQNIDQKGDERKIFEGENKDDIDRISLYEMQPPSLSPLLPLDAQAVLSVQAEVERTSTEITRQDNDGNKNNRKKRRLTCLILPISHQDMNAAFSSRQRKKTFNFTVTPGQPPRKMGR